MHHVLSNHEFLIYHFCEHWQLKHVECAAVRKFKANIKFNIEIQ